MRSTYGKITYAYRTYVIEKNNVLIVRTVRSHIATLHWLFTPFVSVSASNCRDSVLQDYVGGHLSTRSMIVGCC